MDRLIELQKWVVKQMSGVAPSSGYMCGRLDALRDVRIHIDETLEDEGTDIAEKAGE